MPHGRRHRALYRGRVTRPEGKAKTATVRAIFDTIAPRYDLLNDVLTLGLHRRWRRAAVQTLGKVDTDATVLDLASGTGDVCELLVDRGLEPVGVDPSLGMLAIAKERFEGNIPFFAAYGEALPFRSDSVDVITCAFALRQITDLSRALTECARVLRPGGKLMLLDANKPTNWVSLMTQKLLRYVAPRLGAGLADRDTYEYWFDSFQYLPAPAEIQRALEEVGFTAAERITFSAGMVQVYVAQRTPA